MRRSSLSVVAACLGLLVASAPASAVPIFANGQGGVACSLCHSVIPQLNSYGRYVLATNFSRGLNRHLQMTQNQSLPVALEATANVSHPSPAGLPPLSTSIVQWLSAGFLGKDVSYFATVPMVSGGFPASSVDQLWIADNAVDHGRGSLQIGRFATPVFAPWLSQSLSLSGYALAGLQVGANATTLADNRWGASYTHGDDDGVIANVAYLSGNGTAWSGSVQFLSAESHWSGGVAALVGTLANGGGATDRYAREAALVSYDAGRFQLLSIGALGRDSAPLPFSSATSASGSVTFESIYAPRPWLHLDTRYERTDDGLGNTATNYILDAAVNLRSNIVLTVEDAAHPGSTPITQYQLLWAGPWYRERMPPGTMEPAPAALGISVTRARELANGRAIYYTGKDLDGVRIAGTDPLRVYQSCAVCHRPTGAGGVLLPDGAISAELGPHAHMRDDMGSSMGTGGQRWSLVDFEHAIASGVDPMGMTLSPVMPRWKMSRRDLHDISLYVLTQLHPHG